MKTPMVILEAILSKEELAAYLEAEENELMEEEIKEYMGYTDPPEFRPKDRSRAEHRRKDIVHARRRRDKDRSLRGHSLFFEDWYGNLHEYSKGKIHCSCPICKIRTNDKRAIVNEPPVRDKRKLLQLAQEIEDYGAV